MAFENEEATAEMRLFAGNLRGMYVALMQAGFTEGEAFRILGEVIGAALGKGSGA